MRNYDGRLKRLERLEQRNGGAAADRELQLMLWAAERFGWGAIDDPGVEPPTPEEQALLDELDEGIEYDLTPEEQLAEHLAAQQAAAGAPGQPGAPAPIDGFGGSDGFASAIAADGFGGSVGCASCDCGSCSGCSSSLLM
jgi:hypothetical protein